MAFELKRFWDQASVSESDVGFSVVLDGRDIKTPLKRPFILPSRALAEEIAVEWQAIEGKVDTSRMPYTSFAYAALDQAVDERAEIAAKIALYGETDLLCYRAEAPQELVQRQADAWDPLLHWSAEALSAPLKTTAGIVHVAQTESSLISLANHVQPFQGFAL